MPAIKLRRRPEHDGLVDQVETFWPVGDVARLRASEADVFAMLIEKLWLEVTAPSSRRAAWARPSRRGSSGRTR
jgi:hypothetical protein